MRGKVSVGKTVLGANWADASSTRQTDKHPMVSIRTGNGKRRCAPGCDEGGVLRMQLALLKDGRSVERTLFWRIKNNARDQKAVRRGRWKYLRDGVGRNDSVHEFLFDPETDWAPRRDLTIANAAMLPDDSDWEADVDSSRARAAP